MDKIESNKINKFETVNSVVLGQNIKVLRSHMKLTRDELSELSSVSVDYLGKIERGQDIPSLAVGVRIADALNTTLDYLLYENSGVAAPESSEIKLNKLISRMSENDKKFLIKFLELHKLYRMSIYDDNG